VWSGAAVAAAGALLAVRWLPGEPGAFATFTRRSGVARVWNVSQDAPMDHMR
jgi:hypothetical protein